MCPFRTPSLLPTSASKEQVVPFHLLSATGAPVERSQNFNHCGRRATGEAVRPTSCQSARRFQFAQRHVTFTWNVCGDATDGTERVSRKPRDRLRLSSAVSDTRCREQTPLLTAWVSSRQQKRLLMICLSRTLLQGISFCLDTHFCQIHI